MILVMHLFLHVQFPNMMFPCRWFYLLFCFITSFDESFYKIFPIIPVRYNTNGKVRMRTPFIKSWCAKDDDFLYVDGNRSL